MKLVVIGVVALVVGLAGGTAITVMRGPKPSPHTPMPVVNGRAAPDTAAGAVDRFAAADSMHAAPARAVVTPPPPVVTAPAAAAPTAPVTGPMTPAMHEGPVRIAPIPVASFPPDTAHAAGYQQLGRIFAKMQTDEAVKIMAYLSDEDVSRVLATLNVKQAAAILAALPSERAARLGRRMIERTPAALAGATP